MDTRHPYLLPAAILIAGALLAVAVYVVRSTEAGSPLQVVSAIRPVSPDDHLVGNPEALVTIVEYSDIDCQYCKDFQKTMAQLMTEYADEGKVAWVYRHFPVINLHQYSASHAEAAECVGEAGGDTLFFSFIDALQQTTPGSDEFHPSGYGAIVEGLGLSVADFTACLESDRHVERVTQDFENAVAAGGEGTPYTVVLIKGAQSIPITGALPYDAMKQVIEDALTSATP